MSINPALAYTHVIGMIIAMKWAMDLGFSQFRQLLWGILALFFAPLVLLILYVRLISHSTGSARKMF